MANMYMLLSMLKRTSVQHVENNMERIMNYK